MDNYLKFWRLFPRFFLGLSFLLSLILVFINIDTAASLLHKLIAIDWQKVSGLFPSVIIIVLIILLSSVGLAGLNLIVAICSRWFKILCRNNWVKKTARKIGLEPLCMTISEIGMDYFLKNQEEIKKYFYMKSWAQPEVLGAVQGLKEHIDQMTIHMKEIRNVDLLQNLDYFQSVTQEQVLRDHLLDEIDEIYYLLIVGFLIAIIGLRGYFSLSLSLITCGAFLIFVVMLLPIICQRKIRLGCLVVVGYLDAFTLGEGATVVDRETLR